MLGIHMVVLVLLVVIVILASMEVYTNARKQALGQVRVRQELLAAQTARGIEGFYRAILDDLELQRRAEAGQSSDSPTPTTRPIARGIIAPLLWQQLRGRATALLELDQQSLAPLAQFTDAQIAPATDVATKAGEWLRSIKKPAISDTVIVDGTPTNLAAMPMPGEKPRVLVALIPTLAIESRFLNDLNTPANIGSMLLDDRLRVLSDEDRKLTGVDIMAANIDPRIREVAEQYVRQSQRGTREFLDEMKLGDVKLEPAMVTIQPVDMPDGRKWWLAVSSSLSEVDQAVGQFFKRALIGAGLVILAMTAVLVSTSVQMIRGRLRLERVQSDMMKRELEQAREIQLMWLPEQQGVEVCIDIAALNQPTSHISGDFYNWFELADGRVCAVIGDVTGHGLPAAFLMATTQLLVRTIIQRVGDPGACLRETNKQLCTHVFSGQFVTLLVAVIDTKRNLLELATAGHPPPLIGMNAEFTPLAVEPQLVLAVEQDVAFKTQCFDLPAGANLLFYTDGVTDVQAPSGDRLGIDGLQRGLHGRFDSARTLVDAALDSIEAFRSGRELGDDLTLLAIRLAPAPAIAESTPVTPEPLAAGPA